MVSESPSPLLSCTVVIPTRNRPAALHLCLEAIQKLTYPNFQVLVVDNAPSNGETRAVTARWNVRYVLEPVAGASRARNRGARTCDTEIVAYLDDDALPDPGWLSALAVELQDPRVMAVTGKVQSLGGEEPGGDTPSARMGLPSFEAAEKRVVDRQTPFWFEIANFGGIGIGPNMAFRRAAFSVWPGFQERLGPGTPIHGGEENYAFFSLIDRGYRVVYTPRAIVHHPCPAPSLAARKARYRKEVGAAAAYMTFLLVEEPRYRWATLQYAIEGLWGKRRSWRATVARRTPSILPRWRKLLAYLSGPRLYLRSRRLRVSSLPRAAVP